MKRASQLDHRLFRFYDDNGNRYRDCFINNSSCRDKLSFFFFFKTFRSNRFQMEIHFYRTLAFDSIKIYWPRERRVWITFDDFSGTKTSIKKKKTKTKRRQRREKNERRIITILSNVSKKMCDLKGGRNRSITRKIEWTRKATLVRRIGSYTVLDKRLPLYSSLYLYLPCVCFFQLNAYHSG